MKTKVNTDNIEDKITKIDSSHIVWWRMPCALIGPTVAALGLSLWYLLSNMS